MQRELLEQADELEKQAKGALLPTIAGSGLFVRQTAPTNAVGGQVSPAAQNTVKLSATQPLFRGLRDFAALRQRGSFKTAQRFAVQAAARQLFYDVATAYYNVLSLNQQTSDYLEEIRVNSERSVELEKFLKLGRSQPSEVLTFKASVSSLEAQLEGSRVQWETAKDVLAFFTGWTRQTAVADAESTFQVSDSVEPYLRLVEQRPEVQQARAIAVAYNEGIPIARGAHLPSVDLAGNYYLERTGALSGVDWDVQLAVTVPLFQGGVIRSQVRQAASAARQYEILLSEARKVAEEEVRTFYETLTGGKAQMQKLSDTAKLSKESYVATLRDYRSGVVRNIDVLQALTAYQGAQRAFDQQRFAVDLASAKLQASIGQRTDLPENGDP